MKFKGSQDLQDLLRFAPRQKQQTEGDRLTLTVLDVIQIVGEGRLDAVETGREEARRVKRPARKSSSEPAGHWDLAQGAYWVTYNETVRIPRGETLVIQPHQELLKNGLWHPTLLIRDWSEVEGVLLMVAARGVRMMEGSPISTGFIIESRQ